MWIVAVAVLLLVAAGVLTASGRSRPRGRTGRWRRLLKRCRSMTRRRTRPDVTRVLVEVATRLQAGTQLAEAWRRSLPHPAPPWADEVMRAAGAGEVGAVLGHWPRAPTGPLQRWRQRDAHDGRDVAAAIAAARLAARTGAPLAEVIDVVVAGIAEAAEADQLRTAALAGPRATARLLAWLPAGGIVLGTVLGADPVAVLLGGGVGGLCLVGGGALFLIGHRWVRTLVTAAERAGR
jgi:tight adherence protein B